MFAVYAVGLRPVYQSTVEYTVLKILSYFQSSDHIRERVCANKTGSFYGRLGLVGLWKSTFECSVIESTINVCIKRRIE